ncbi:acyl-CoA thioesterase [Glutamicibacter protophormiae]|uniref:acyl-CoA thioesterase n=1 Tax=Glutamicibacter protophormiae TaxID=37930 RepID=UPI002A7EAEE2|nr:acyl-CoA thioesterase [Glutamicibacter protophormiae]WPR64002.1 acyl-CoA thioesterase [Glutamicibacter protophormiae]WPR67497.1 acyl-CoA thioesterase [Glutamicibacter protophormiae]
MHMIFRILMVFLQSKKGPKLSMFDTGSVSMRATLTDIDFAGHINNGMYFSIFDLGRFDLMFRSGVWDILRKNKWTPVVQCETITFRKSVELGKKFSQETRLLGLDEKCIYFEQRIVVDGEIYARAYIATRMTSKKGAVSNEEIMQAVGLDVPEDRVVPQWLHDWREHGALPGSRKPAPHNWLG